MVKYFALFDLEGTALEKSSEFRVLRSELINNSALSIRHAALERSELRWANSSAG